jgi:hypothetical protein
VKSLILCECGDFVENHTFKDYIESSFGPSTPTVGHTECGLIFNFIDDGLPKRFSSKKELKAIAIKFAAIKGIDDESQGLFLLEVDRLKSGGNLSDMDILLKAFKIHLARIKNEKIER